MRYNTSRGPQKSHSFPRYPNLAFDEPFAVNQPENKGERAVLLERLVVDLADIVHRDYYVHTFVGLQVNADAAYSAFQSFDLEILAGFFDGVYPLYPGCGAIPREWRLFVGNEGVWGIKIGNCFDVEGTGCVDNGIDDADDDFAGCC